MIQYGIAAVVVIALVGLLLATIKSSNLFVYITSNQFGVLEKKFSRKGSMRSGLIALDGRAGYQPDMIRTGPHFFLPFVYRVHKQSLITVRSMAYVYARDGIPLPAGQTLAKTPEGVTFENLREFLMSGGQRGMQRGIIREGVYAINTAGFVVFTEDRVHAIDIGDDKSTLEQLALTIKDRHGYLPVVLKDTDDSVGVVTVHDGPALAGDDIIAPRVGGDVGSSTFHNSYQDVEAFLAAGGQRGRQEQVITEGTFYINRLFATVEVKNKTMVNVGTVGVVVSYIGRRGEDLSGDTYKHGELVGDGSRGVLLNPLRAGKYAINPYAREIIPVPTTNFVLRWIAGRVEDHGFDRGLSEISLITRDAFQPVLPLSVVVHISPEKAPRVIQRFADIRRLVDQTIDPMVSAFFKDAAQKSTMIDLINKRAELQVEALSAMQTRFAEYDLDLLEVMIGTPKALEGDTAIPAILDQLRQRQTAEQQRETFAAQQIAAAAGRELNEANATAAMQGKLTESLIQVEIADNTGQAEFRRRTQEALALQAIGKAEAAVISMKGLAQAEATKAQVEAFQGEGADNQLRRIIAENMADAIVRSPNAIVPSVMVGGGAGGGGSMIEGLMAMVLNERSKS